MRGETALLSIGLFGFMMSTTALGQVSFRGLGPLPPGRWTNVLAISPDGTVPAGRALGNNDGSVVEIDAVWWPDGIELLEGDTAIFDGAAYGVANGGAVVVGSGQIGTGGPGTVRRAFRSVGSEFQLLPTFAGAVFTYARGVTPDGNTIVGSSGGVPCQWIVDAGPAPLALPSGATSAEAVGVSADARRILGTYRTSNDLGMTLWTDGVPAVVSLSEHPLLTLDAALSLDGETVVGNFVERGVGVRHSFIWTTHDGLILLPDANSIISVSADGSVVGGSSFGPAAALWIDGEVINVEELLAASGIDLADWNLSSVTAISADGRTIAGNGLHRYGDDVDEYRVEGWIATIPGPSTGMLIFASVFAARRRRS